MAKPFKSDLVIEEKISEANFRAYSVGYEQNEFRLKPLVEVICEVIPEFALGYHEGKVTPNTEIVSRLREAARTIYGTDKFENRGEFGELILHLLLRDFHDTIPLVAKIYFKDAPNSTVHGFDGVHITIEPGKKKLWLGESKLYTDGIAGVTALAEDLEKHIKGDYLRSEFSLIKHKLPAETPEIEYWRNLMDEHKNLDEILNGICIPMVCTYSSDTAKNHTAATAAHLKAFTEECEKLKAKFNEKKISTNVDVILMLLPIPSKEDLVAELDKRLKAMRMD
jgi:Cap4 SAVED domain